MIKFVPVVLGIATLAACAPSPSVAPAPEPAAPPAPEPLTITVHLRSEAVVVESPIAGEVGMAETGAHEAGWFKEDCVGADHICHPLQEKRAQLRQVHHADEVGAGATLFDNHFGGSLSYVVRSADGQRCWASSEYYELEGCAQLTVHESVEELLAGHVEPTHWNDPSVPKHAASPDQHAAPPPVAKPTEEHTRTIEKLRKAHTPAAKHCCKRCSKGQPCGNSCISWSKTCHTVGGCAC